MSKGNLKYILAIIALAAILVAGALYADKVYVPPEPPPNIIYTIKGPVILYEEAEPGDLVTAPNLGTIYYLNNQSQRVVFPDEQTFLTWYPDYDDVKTIPRELLESFPLSGRNVTIRPGTLLITIPSSYQVWMISYPNDIHWLKGGESQVIDLFGENWTERLVDLQEYYFDNYHDDYAIENFQIYPVGLLIHAASNDQYYLTVDHGQRMITAEGLTANRFQTKYAIERDEPLDLDVTGPPIDGYEPRWGSPDMREQAQDPGPQHYDIGDGEVEVG